MSAEHLAGLVTQFVDDVWNQRNITVVETYFSSDWVWHGPPGLPTDRSGLTMMMGMFQGAFSDISTTVDDLIAEGDRVVWRWTFRGTHTAEFMGIPASNKRVAFSGISIDRIAGSKFVERWDQADMLGLMQQLGPAPAS